MRRILFFIICIFFSIILIFVICDGKKEELNTSPFALLRLVGATVESIAGIFIKTIPLSSINEQEYALVIRNKFEKNDQSLEYLKANKVMKILSKRKTKNIDYEVLITNDDNPNAYAVPGGLVIISRNLCKMMNEDEIAAIIGHEMGHIELSHSIDNLKIKITAEKIKIESLQDLAKKGSELFVNATYSMAQENEADEYAWVILKTSGYDTKGLSSSLKKLKNEYSKLLINKVNRTYFYSHPPIESRIEKFTERERINSKNP